MAPSETERGYVYLRVTNSDDSRLDPAELTNATGIVATTSWRLGEAHPKRPGVKRRFDLWEVKSSIGKQANLNGQLAALMAQLDLGWAELVAASKPHGAVLQYVVHTDNEPFEFDIDAKTIQKVVQLGAVIDCDIYCEVSDGVEDGRCKGCDIALPTTLAAIKDHIGGELRAAEMQMKFLVHGIEESEAAGRFDFDEDCSCRLDGEIEAVYLRELTCLQIASHFLPTSSYVAAIEPEAWMSKFLEAVTSAVADLPGAKRELRVIVTERGDYQGATGLHFDSELIRRIQDLSASLTIRLRFLPEPLFDGAGNCMLCDKNALG